MSTVPMIAAARMRAGFDRPYLCSALYALQFIPKEGLLTIAVDDRWRCYYDESWCSKKTAEELAAVLIHEVCHLLQDHSGRRPKDVDPALWNLAGDLEINDGLLEEGLQLPQDGQWPEKFGFENDKLAEEYLILLQQRQQQSNKGKARKGDNGQPDPSLLGGACGSCAHGQREEHEEAGGEAEGNAKDPNYTPGVGRGQSELIRREVARAIAGSPPGRVPGGWRRWAETKLSSKVDWRVALRAAIRNTVANAMGADDYSWVRPNRRQGATNIILPALRGRKPKAGIIIDTSGSMSEKMLSQALVEVQGVIAALGCEVYVAAADTMLHAVKRCMSAKDVDLLGGGGTDMSVAIVDFLARPEARRINSLIVITDCETGWPSTKPALPCTIVNVGRGSPPPWPCSLVLVDSLD